MIRINNYKEFIKTPNGDGTKRIEFVGCKLTYEEKEVEANIIFPKVQDTGLTSEQSVTTFSMENLASPDAEEVLFSICVYDEDISK